MEPSLEDEQIEPSQSMNKFIIQSFMFFIRAMKDLFFTVIPSGYFEASRKHEN